MKTKKTRRKERMRHAPIICAQCGESGHYRGFRPCSRCGVTLHAECVLHHHVDLHRDRETASNLVE